MILGLDFDVRAIHLALLDDYTDRARYVPVAIADKRGSFEAARNVRQATAALPPDLLYALRELVWLAAVEKPFSQSRGTAHTYGLLTGAILPLIPRHVPLLPLVPNERVAGWKANSVGKTNASKPEIALWATGKLARAGCSMAGWTQDGLDAYSIAYAARALNQRGIAAA